MTNTSTNKRPRTSSSSPEPRESAPREVNYHPRFKKTDLSDIILESEGGQHFATSRIHLQSSSFVFRDTLLVGQDQASEELDGLPLIKLQDESEPLYHFLAFVQVEPSILLHGAALNSIPPLDAVLTLCDKYHAPLAGRLIVDSAFARILWDLEDETYGPDGDTRAHAVDNNLINFLALALIWSQYHGDHWIMKMIALMGVRGVADFANVSTSMKMHSLTGRLEAFRGRGHQNRSTKKAGCRGRVEPVINPDEISDGGGDVVERTGGGFCAASSLMRNLR